MKIDLTPLFSAHYATLVDAGTGRRRRRDIALFVVPALAPPVAALCFEGQLSKEAAAALLTVTGLLGAFLFSTMLQISQRAMDWADKTPAKGKQTSDDADFLKGISANAGYAAVVLSGSSLLFVVATATEGTANTISSALALALTVHGFLTLQMVIVKVFAVTTKRLTEAAAGRDEA